MLSEERYAHFERKLEETNRIIDEKLTYIHGILIITMGLQQ